MFYTIGLPTPVGLRIGMNQLDDLDRIIQHDYDE